ncbi:MAG: hypothetical protein ACRC7I_00230 [Selenomonadaceae bacterium]
MTNLTKAKAETILRKHVSQEHLILHAKSVSAAMGAMALYFGEDKEHWEAVGYLHDVDYEKFPEEHCQHVRELLADEAVGEEDIRAIISHGYGLCTQEVPPQSNMEKSLFTVDELTGIVMASALMRPSGIADMDLKSLKKKFKDKRFAAKCSREVIASGFELLGLAPDVVMQCCIDGMREHKAELGI